MTPSGSHADGRGPSPASGLWACAGVDTDAVARSIVANASELIGVVDADLRLVAVNERLLDVTGHRAETLLGAPALDVVAPDDVERAALLFSLSRQGRPPAGTGGFGLRCTDGRVVDTYVTACEISVGGASYLAVVARPTYMPAAMDRILDGLLQGADLAATLAPILDFFAWRENGSKISITWDDPSTGATRALQNAAPPDTLLPDSLSGVERRAGDPWYRAVRSGASSWITDVAELEADRRHAAHAAGVARAWIQPVPGSGDVVALVTAWVTSPDLDPAMHGYAMAAAHRHIAVVLGWTDQVRRLDAAAHQDALTGLANRRAFFDAIERSNSGGAVLYCDLDGFKPVNDRWGHAAGDTLLVEIGRRISAEVREGDLVARLGGDEFAVVLWGASEGDAARVAERIATSCGSPVELSQGTVAVGISVGVAHHELLLDERLVETADQRLYEAKRENR